MQIGGSVPSRSNCGKVPRRPPPTPHLNPGQDLPPPRILSGPAHWAATSPSIRKSRTVPGWGQVQYEDGLVPLARILRIVNNQFTYPRLLSAFLVSSSNICCSSATGSGGGRFDTYRFSLASILSARCR